VSRKETLPPRGERVADRTARAAAILQVLRTTYPDAQTALVHRNPFELLIATILSAQCTDERVNLVTPKLFRRFPTPARLGAGDPAEVEAIVQPTGFFRQKAKNIRATGARLANEFGGEVPSTMEELLTLPGVARKTANVLLSNCYPEQAVGIAVDTHVQRIARRLGWTRSWDPVQVERDLVKLLPRDEWNHVTHVLIEHGRATCTARTTPHCPECPIAHLCPSATRFHPELG
jgi:endonuclease-3